MGKKAYKFNTDIRIEYTYNNIQLVTLNYKYVKRFYELINEYEKNIIKITKMLLKKRMCQIKNLI